MVERRRGAVEAATMAGMRALEGLCALRHLLALGSDSVWAFCGFDDME